jgi:ATP-binding cassette subfamily F protein uup
MPDEAPAEKRASAGDIRQARKELARLERQLDKLAEREQFLHEQLAAAATDYERLQTLQTELRALHAERVSAEESWLSAADRLER